MISNDDVIQKSRYLFEIVYFSTNWNIKCVK